jgi:hypothetical protein
MKTEVDYMSPVKLVILLEELMSEVGDLDKMISYPIKKINDLQYSFEISEDLTAVVKFTTGEVLDQSLLNSLKIPTKPSADNTYNVGYIINGTDTQAKKLDYSTLIKVLKTVSEITIKFIKSHKNLEALLFVAWSKTGQPIKGTYLDPQKYDLYKAIIIKNLNKIGQDWNYGQYKLLNIPTLVLFKKEK